MTARPVRLTASFREKIWGVLDLKPWFHAQNDRIGEVWFLNPAPDPLRILVKFIFTSDLLSVQVHPDDEFAWAHGDVSGKTEMWYILRAEPGARLAMGLRERTSRNRLREASVSGDVEALLQWFEVRPGQVYFIPPGTVHALGPGITLCEIQQHADITYRLYDYGRPRELHLDKAVAVAKNRRSFGETPPRVALRLHHLIVRHRHQLHLRQRRPDPQHAHLQRRVPLAQQYHRGPAGHHRAGGQRRSGRQDRRGLLRLAWGGHGRLPGAGERPVLALHQLGSSLIDNAEMSLAKADMGVARLYASLATGPGDDRRGQSRPSDALSLGPHRVPSTQRATGAERCAR